MTTKTISAGKLGRYLVATRHITSRRPTKERVRIWFFCPGCQEKHYVEMPPHDWDGSLDKPTLSPSVISRRCRAWVQEGRITFSRDSDHYLAGRVVEMVENEQW